MTKWKEQRWKELVDKRKCEVCMNYHGTLDDCRKCMNKKDHPDFKEFK